MPDGTATGAADAVPGDNDEEQPQRDGSKPVFPLTEEPAPESMGRRALGSGVPLGDAHLSATTLPGAQEGGDRPKIGDSRPAPKKVRARPGAPPKGEPAGDASTPICSGTAVQGPKDQRLSQVPAQGAEEESTAVAASPDKPKIGDSRPAPFPAKHMLSESPKGPGDLDGNGLEPSGKSQQSTVALVPSSGGRRRRRRGKRSSEAPATLSGATDQDEDEESLRSPGRERKGRPIGRYLMCVHASQGVTQVGVLEGRSLVEHYVSRASDAATQIDGNIYLGRVKNVLPGMEAAFVDIGTPKNAVLYWGDVHFDEEDLVEGEPAPRKRIEQVLKPGQSILCQVTKNPIGLKGARLTQEVSLPGRFVVMVPNSSTYGISKRLDDRERRRLRKIIDDIRPEGHGMILRTAAEGASAAELRRDVARLLGQWQKIESKMAVSTAPVLLYGEPDMAVRVIREEFNREYRGVIIDDPALYDRVLDYVSTVNPELADRVEYYDLSKEKLPLFERHHIHEQLHKALDRKVWLPSGGSLIIERTEALTVIDVNTGKNVGKTNLEETVYRNNLEAAEEVARQLRLRDIGGIIVIDFIDMEVKKNRDKVAAVFREALARDKTRTQVFDISELGLVEMTRKRVSEGLVEAFSQACPTCGGRGIVFDESLL